VQSELIKKSGGEIYGFEKRLWRGYHVKPCPKDRHRLWYITCSIDEYHKGLGDKDLLNLCSERLWQKRERENN